MRIDYTEKKELLLQGGYTCIMFRDTEVNRTKERGVKPLIQWLDSGKDFSGYCAIDKVVGKAAAFLYVLLGISSLYALVISEPAIQVLECYGIEMFFEDKVPAIRNRTNTGFCPMEQAVSDLEEPKDAEAAIRRKIEELS